MLNDPARPGMKEPEVDYQGATETVLALGTSMQKTFPGVPPSVTLRKDFFLPIFNEGKKSLRLQATPCIDFDRGEVQKQVDSLG